jgi:hypothetical protein
MHNGDVLFVRPPTLFISGTNKLISIKFCKKYFAVVNIGSTSHESQIVSCTLNRHDRKW